MKLAHALIGKSIAEAILVGALAVVAYAWAFPPTYHGWGEVVSNGIAGWAVNHADNAERLEVQLFIDQRYVGEMVANESRPDIVASGWAKDEWHGYRFVVSSLKSGIHEARVYALHISADNKRRTLQLLGDPIVFEVNSDGALQDKRLAQ